MHFKNIFSSVLAGPLLLSILLALPNISHSNDSLERDIILLHRKLNTLSRKIDDIQNNGAIEKTISTSSFSGSEVANINAKIDNLEERLRGITTKLENTERLNKARTNTVNFLKQDVEKKITTISDKLSQINEIDSSEQSDFNLKTEQNIATNLEIAKLLNNKTTVLEENQQQIIEANKKINVALNLANENIQELYQVIKAQNNYIGDLTLSHKNALIKIKALEQDNVEIGKYLSKINVLPDSYSSKVSKEVNKKNPKIELDVPEIENNIEPKIEEGAKLITSPNIKPIVRRVVKPTNTSTGRVISTTRTAPAKVIPTKVAPRKATIITK